VTLVDTSAWIEFLRCTGSTAHVRLRALISSDAPLATTDPVVMELLAGAGSSVRARELRRLLGRFHHEPTHGLADFESAASLFRACRSGGSTVRSLMDCLIAAVAIRSGMSVLSADRDFVALARYSELRLD
jgi:predicted nucleic acid-binding protein